MIETDSALLHMSPLQLLGLVKVSLSQFYLAFADSDLVPSLLEAEYPVVAMDSYCPITSPLTGSTHGHLGVLLALGSSQQVGGQGHGWGWRLGVVRWEARDMGGVGG